MSTRTWIIFAAVCVVLFGGLIIYSGRDRVDVSDVNTNKIQPASENSGNIGDHVFGNKDAKVVLVEYGDFQCPGCERAYPNAKAVSEKYKDQLAFVFRNFPLTNIHPNARAAAAVAEAAGKLGKYWEMHNTLYDRQDEWSDADANERGDLFAGYAEEIGLNREKFLTTLNETGTTGINRKINFDIAMARKVNVTGTPTFYLNGRVLGGEEFDGEAAFENTLQNEFQKQGVSIPEDTGSESNQ